MVSVQAGIRQQSLLIVLPLIGVVVQGADVVDLTHTHTPKKARLRASTREKLTFKQPWAVAGLFKASVQYCRVL